MGRSIVCQVSLQQGYCPLPYFTTWWKQVNKHRTHSSLGGGKGKVKLNSWSGEGICIIWNSSVLEMYLFSLLPSSFTTSFPLSFSSLPSFTICNNLFFLGMDTGKVLYNLDYSLILHYFIATNVPASVIGSSFRLAPVFFDMHCPFDLWRLLYFLTWQDGLDSFCIFPALTLELII